MNFQDLMDKAKTNWKYITLIVSVVILLVILYCYYKKGSTTEGMYGTNDESSQELSHDMPPSNPTTGAGAGTGTGAAQQEVKTDGEIVLYYATWCGYSRMFLPEWQKFETYAKGNLPNLKVSSIRCEGGNEATCTQKGVDGYPTIILYLNSGKELQFNGERTSQQLVDFVKKYI